MHLNDLFSHIAGFQVFYRTESKAFEQDSHKGFHCNHIVVMSHAKLPLTRRGLAEMRLPFFSSSDSRGEGGGVAFWARSLFCGESSTRTASPPSLSPGPGGSAAGRNTPTP